MIKDGDVVVGYEVSFPNGEGEYLPAVQVPAYISNPIIHFYSDAERQTEVTSLTGLSQETTLYFTVVGSFGSKPQMFAACEGNWTSSALTYDLSTDGTKYVTGSVKVKPTTAYVGDSTDGKLTLYVPYYGATGIGQISLSASASGNVQIMNMQILPKKADDTSATVTFQLDEGASAPFSDGEEKECEPLPVLVYDNYTITGRDNGFETVANFQGTPVSNSWLGKGTCKYNPTTKTYTQTIDIAINTDTKNSRAGAVVVFSPSGRELARFIVEQAACEATNPDKPVINDITINKLVPSGANSANCYIITAPGRYELPAYMGAYSNSELADNLLCKGTPDIVWNDNESNNKIEFYQGHLSQDKIIIDVNPTKDNGVVTGHGSSISPGNAVIALKDSKGDIQWSWHLWFCNSEVGLQNYGDDNYLMDRYLGASKTATDGLSLVSSYISLYWKDGLYYQSGRKDPFKVYETTTNNVTTYTYEHTAQTGASVDNSVKNPTYFYKDWSSESGWESTKGQHDPCPPGYRVPSADVWTKSKNEFNRITNANNWLFVYDYLILDAIVYPYAGHLNTQGKYQAISDGTERLPRAYKNRLPIVGGGTELLVPSSETQISNPTSNYPTPKKFDNIKYELINETRTADLLSAGGDEIAMGYKTKGVKITEYTVTEGVWEKNKYLSIWTAKYNNATTKTYTDDTGLTPKEREEILNAIQNYDVTVDNITNNWQDIIVDLFNGYQDEVVYSTSQNATSRACLVRCLAETPPTNN